MVGRGDFTMLTTLALAAALCGQFGDDAWLIEPGELVVVDYSEAERKIRAAQGTAAKVAGSRDPRKGPRAGAVFVRSGTEGAVASVVLVGQMPMVEVRWADGQAAWFEDWKVYPRDPMLRRRIEKQRSEEP